MCLYKGTEGVFNERKILTSVSGVLFKQLKAVIFTYKIV